MGPSLDVVVGRRHVADHPFGGSVPRFRREAQPAITFIVVKITGDRSLKQLGHPVDRTLLIEETDE
jgi:hypothetical protein